MNSVELFCSFYKLQSMSHCIFSFQGRFGEIVSKHYYLYQLMIWKWETCILAWKLFTRIHPRLSMSIILLPFVQWQLYFFCAGKVCWNCHQTLILVSIDDMKVRNLHTSVEIIHQNSSKLVNDAPLISFQSVSHCILSVQGRYVETVIKH